MSSGNNQDPKLLRSHRRLGGTNGKVGPQIKEPAIQIAEPAAKNKKRYARVNLQWYWNQHSSIKNALRPTASVKQLFDMTPDEIAAIESRYGAKIRKP